MQKTETTTVLPGVQFEYIPALDYKNASFAVGFKYKCKRGRSSADTVLAHLLFRSSEDYPTYALFSRRLEELYATDLSAQSLRQGDFRAALFQATFLDEPFAREIPDFTRAVLSVLSGAILRPALSSDGLFCSDAVEREKETLLDRVRSIKNSKSAYTHERLCALVADPRRYDLPDYGNEEEIAAVTPKTLMERYRGMLYRSEVVFVYAGSLPKETVLGLIRELFGKLLFLRRPLRGKVCMPRLSSHSPVLRVSEQTDGEQAMLGLAYRMPAGFGEEGVKCLPMLTAVLSDAPMSLLFSEVRERGGYCYSIRAIVKPASRNLFILCGIAPGTETSVERAVSRVLTEVRTGKTDPSLLQAGRTYLQMTLTSIWESVDATVNFVLSRRLFGRRIDPELLLREAEAITADDLSSFMKKVRPDAVFLLAPKGGGQRG